MKFIDMASQILGYVFLIMALILIVMCAGCAGTSTTYEISLGRNMAEVAPWSRGLDGGFEGPKDTVNIAVRHEMDDGRLFVEWRHVSHLSAGWPFNNKNEDWLDMASVGCKFTDRH